jgi:hypothetical protein
MAPGQNDDANNIVQIRNNVDLMASTLRFHEPGSISSAAGSKQTYADRRAYRRPGPRSDVVTLSLVERNGLVFWEVGTPIRPELRRSRRAGGFWGRLIVRKDTPTLAPNEIVGYLENLDNTLTPQRGLQQWTAQGLVPNAKPIQTGKILLFVHGTFSKSQHLFDEIQAAQGGPEFLNRANGPGGYDQILAFDHPTISVSPLVNAVDLRNAFSQSQASVDIVCHSRGGLVARWWMEVLDACPTRQRRAVFVGSPLTGTSLAAPDKLRSGLKLLSTYGSLLGKSAMAAPLLNAPGALLVIFASIARMTSSIPLIDAGVSMIPGLNGQSRVTNSLELSRLNQSCANCPPNYFFISSNFEPKQIGWNILKGIRQIGINTANVLADGLVFPGDNDLVVDTEAMTTPWTSGISAGNSHKFEEADAVHHTVYFRQPKTISFIADALWQSDAAKAKVG